MDILLKTSAAIRGGTGLALGSPGQLGHSPRYPVLPISLSVDLSDAEVV